MFYVGGKRRWTQITAFRVQAPLTGSTRATGSAGPLFRVQHVLTARGTMEALSSVNVLLEMDSR